MTQATVPAGASLERFFNPRGIAIVGASSNPSSISGQYLRYLRGYGYEGQLYPVNPRHQQISELQCYPSVVDAPGSVDVAIVVVPSGAVLQTMRDCAAARVPFVVVPSAGFREAGPEGVKLENEMLSIAREGGIRVLGPNCMGFVNFKDKVVGSFGAFLSSGDELTPGNVGLVTQSGAFGAVVIRKSLSRGIGFTYEVSTGNEADLGALDFIEFLLTDPDTKVIAAFLEGIKGADRLVRIGREAARLGKPLVVLKAGKSPTAVRAVQSHTGRISSPARIYEGIFEQAGMVEVNTSTEFIDAIEAFSRLSVAPRGNRVALVVGSGGNGVLLADNSDSLGLQVPELSAASQQKINAKIPDAGSAVNPVDVTAQIAHNAHDGMVAVAEAVFEDPGIDLVVIGTNHLAIKECWQDFIRLAKESGKPLGVVASHDVPDEIIQAFRNSGAVLPDEDGYEILRKLRLLRLRAERAERLSAAAEESAWDPASYEIAKPAGGLSEADAKDLLRGRLPIPDGEAVSSREQAAEVAERLGYPVVAKLVSPTVQHKSDLGALRLNLKSADAVREAYDALISVAEQHQIQNAGVLVEKMAPAGTEVVVGLLRDPQLGPVVAFGAGGVLVELVKDIVYRAAPLNAADARDMIQKTLASKLLAGFRGEPARDVEALVGLLVEASRLFVANPWMRELEFNPVMVLPAGQGAAVLDVIVNAEA